MSTLFSRLGQSGQDYSSLMGEEAGELQARNLATEQLKAASAHPVLKWRIGQQKEQVK